MISFSVDSFKAELRNIFNSEKPINDVEGRRLRLYRRYYRTLLFPELVLDEIPDEEKESSGLSFEQREFCYELLGNRSKEIRSLDDIDLFKALYQMLKNYKPQPI